MSKQLKYLAFISAVMCSGREISSIEGKKELPTTVEELAEFTILAETKKELPTTVEEVVPTKDTMLEEAPLGKEIEIKLNEKKDPQPVKHSEETLKKAEKLIEEASRRLENERSSAHTFFWWHLWYWGGYYPEMHKDIDENGLKGTFDRNQHGIFNRGDRTIILDGGDMKAKIHEKYSG